MTGLETAVASEALKVAANKSEGLFKSIFGKAFEEGAEMIRDNVRLRRFKNQIKIFEKAKEHLKGKNIDPQKINLKVLAPLVEYSGLEEDENLQDLWDKMIKNIVSKPFSLMLQQKAIEILKAISNEEVYLLEHLMNRLKDSKADKARAMESLRKNIQEYTSMPPVDPSVYRIGEFDFEVEEITSELGLTLDEMELLISNLISFGLMGYVVKADAQEGQHINPFRKYPAVTVAISDNERIRITQLGYAFVDLCKS